LLISQIYESDSEQWILAMTELLLVMTSLPDMEAAKVLARRLIDTNLAACVQIQTGVQSIYRWQGRICEEQEVVLVAKTTAKQWSAISTYIKQNHPYDAPEIIAQPITHSHADYARWVIAETKDTSA
jgi:periplasmic divalent cation tolerance protein